MDYRLRSRDLLFCFLLFVLAYVVSLIVLFYFYPPLNVSTLDVDEGYYYQQAKKIVDGTYTLNFYRPVGFATILAGALYLANSSLLGAKLILLVIASLKAPLLYIFMKRLTGNVWVSLFSGLILAVWPTTTYLSVSFYSESVSPTLFLIFINLLPFGESPGVFWRWIAAGLIFGLLIMVHPSFIMYTPFLFLIVFLEQRNWKTALQKSLLAFLGVVLIVAPWSYIVSKKAGKFVLLSVNGADALAGGLNSNLIETGYQLTKAPNGRVTWVGPGMWTTNNGYLTPAEEALPPVQRNDVLFEKVLNWVWDHPKDTLYLEAAKLANLWGIYPIFLELEERLIFGNIPILIMLFLSLCALWKWRHEYRMTARLWTVMVFVCFVALASCGSWRYRSPADSAMIALAVMFVYYKLTGDSLDLRFDGRTV